MQGPESQCGEKSGRSYDLPRNLRGRELAITEVGTTPPRAQMIGALSMPLIHMGVHIGHFRLPGQTGASRLLVLLAVLTNGAAVVLGGYHPGLTSPVVPAWIAGFSALSSLVETLLRRATRRDFDADARKVLGGALRRRRGAALSRVDVSVSRETVPWA